MGVMAPPIPLGSRGRLAAGLVGCLTYLAIGWTAMLIPSLIRSIEAAFGQPDAAIGVVYLVYAGAYASGSFAGGPLTERVGRRRVLGGALIVAGIGVAGLGLAPTWSVFILAALMFGGGAGCLNGGSNGLILDVFREGRGRAMNLLHTSFSVGALASPLLVGALVAGGIPWQAVAVGTGAVVALLALAYLIVPMPSGRRATGAAGTRLPSGSAGGSPRLLTGPLLLLGFAVGTYVASEVGLTSWLVRFLERAPLTTATLALSLYWAGLTVGRLISSVVADRFDHLRFATACASAMSVLIAIAVVAPPLPLSIAAFAAAGVAAGPVFPMIIAIGGDRHPERSAAVAGSLTGLATVGSTVYPPTMGLLSVTVGLPMAMFGSAVLATACALALVVFGRATWRRG
jgi:fucose permease